METTAENSKHLWSVREKLQEHCMQHWSVIGFSKPATMEQLYRPSVSGPEFKEIFEESLHCSLLMLYTDTCVVSFGDHSACSGHFGCKVLSWVANEEWVDTIGLDTPTASVEVMAWALCLFRIWRLQILRSFWTSAAAPAPPRNLGQSFFQGCSIVKLLPLAASQLGSCGSSGHAWRLRAARYSLSEARPLGAGRPATASGAQASRLQSRRSDHRLR